MKQAGSTLYRSESWPTMTTRCRRTCPLAPSASTTSRNEGPMPTTWCDDDAHAPARATDVRQQHCPAPAARGALASAPLRPHERRRVRHPPTCRSRSPSRTRAPCPAAACTNPSAAGDAGGGGSVVDVHRTALPNEQPWPAHAPGRRDASLRPAPAPAASAQCRPSSSKARAGAPAAPPAPSPQCPACPPEPAGAGCGPRGRRLCPP